MQDEKKTQMLRVDLELLKKLRQLLPDTVGLTWTGTTDVALRRLIKVLEEMAQ